MSNPEYSFEFLPTYVGTSFELSRRRLQLCRLTVVAAIVLSLTVPLALAQTHEDIFVGHSPPDADTPPTPENPCPTLEPLRLFPADNAVVGGSIPPGGGQPANPGAMIQLNHLAIGAALAKPEFGGFVYALSQPGLNFIDPSNPCHGMSTGFTGGQSFLVRLGRTLWPDGINFAVAEPFGTPILTEDGTSWQFGTSGGGGHAHPIFLARRAGGYTGEFRFTSDRFAASGAFSLRFTTVPKCGAAVPLDLSTVFNTDVVDSDLADTPVSFDGAGHFWLKAGLYGEGRGLPADGTLGDFQLGAPDGAGLAGSNANCLFDNGTLSCAAAVNLTTQNLAGQYESMELLIAAAGSFTANDRLIIRLQYATGADQVVTVRQAPTAPRFFPIVDWQITTSPLPHLAVGRSGTRDGGGLARSTGSAVDGGASPIDSFYFSRITFPLDLLRTLESLAFDDYTGTGRLGIFAVTLIAAAVCHDGDADQDDDVDGDDYAEFVMCMTGPDAGPPLAGCEVMDFDFDEDVDMVDCAEFVAAFTGAL